MFDSSLAKFDIHNTAYNTESHSLENFPTCRVLLDNTYKLGVSLHKWMVDPVQDAGNRGCYIAIYTLSDTENIDKENCEKLLEELKKKCYGNFIKSIQDGKLDKNITVFKFSVNCWRPVKKKGKKWTYIGDKPHKNSEQLIQRLLYD